VLKDNAAMPVRTMTQRLGPEPFPSIVWTALLLEVVERFAFYGVYVNLAIYLTDTVRMSAPQTGVLLGGFAACRSWIPVLTGALSDRIGFRRSLMIAFAGYGLAYGTLYAWPQRVGAYAAVLLMSIAGAFLKPVIPATVRRYAPEGRERTGFSLFYASVNAGSVVGKVLTKIVRTCLSLRATMINAIVASFVGLALAFVLFKEPDARGQDGMPELPELGEENKTKATLRALSKTPQLFIFLALVSGYYLLIEQFYQTFPIHIVRLFGENAPREYITLINPAAIAILQVPLAALTKRIPALWGMGFGVLLGALSMFLMGAFPSLYGACVSFFVFALAEMLYSPRYYQYTSSFAPKGGEGLTMGVSLIPLGVGGLAGGVLSGRLIERYLPRVGPKEPFLLWSNYALIGVLCACALFVFAYLNPTRPQQRPPLAFKDS
jgi:proton-dependent oligopeptide transporter, POT family